jgi:hypothetical protein
MFSRDVSRETFLMVVQMPLTRRVVNAPKSVMI